MYFATASMVYEEAERTHVKRVTRAATTAFGAASLSLQSLLRHLSLVVPDGRSGKCTLTVNLTVTCFQSQVGDKLVYQQQLVDVAEESHQKSAAERVSKDLDAPIDVVPEDKLEQAGGAF